MPVALLRPDTGFDINHVCGMALLDTGATNSGITLRMVHALGLEGQGKRPLNGVHGEQQTERYIFRIGLFPDRTADDPETLPVFFDAVDGIELKDSFRFDALIGMDVLSQCDLFLDRSGGCALAFGHHDRLLLQSASAPI